MTKAPVLARFAGRRIGIIGDVMLDHFLIGRADRISPEAPVPVVRLEREEFRPGGAANVAANVLALTGTPLLIGLVGEDDAGRLLATTLRAAGIDQSRLVTDLTRPTTEKLRAVTERHQQVVRIDRESSAPATGAALEALLQRVAALDALDALVLSDYAKGVVITPVIAAAVDAAHRMGCPLLVDPKAPDASSYRGATLITPNRREAEVMAGVAIRDDEGARRAARRIHEASGASVLITWGERGLWVFDASGGRSAEAAIPAAAREVADVTGAGDTVIATLALALGAGAPLLDAARLANLAAGIAVGRFGPAAVSAQELDALVNH